MPNSPGFNGKISRYGSCDRVPESQRYPETAMKGRVLDACGYYFGTSPKPSVSSDSAGYKPSKAVFNYSLAPVGLSLCALSAFLPPILNQYPVLDRLHLGPRWHAVAQHLFE
jgi:hypothetical protein